jgi:hypothetical protein
VEEELVELELLDELVEPVVELEFEELELDDELELLLEEAPLELELDEDKPELEEVLLELVEPVVELELEELELPTAPGIEHSFTPPDTRLPGPKVTSPQIKLPLSNLYVNRSARP